MYVCTHGSSLEKSPTRRGTLLVISNTHESRKGGAIPGWRYSHLVISLNVIISNRTAAAIATLAFHKQNTLLMFIFQFSKISIYKTDRVQL
jgi:hypothetical protein